MNTHSLLSLSDDLPAAALTENGGAIAAADTGLVLAPTLALAPAVQPIQDLATYLRTRRPVPHFSGETRLWTLIPDAVAAEVRALLDAFSLVTGYVRAKLKVQPACERVLRLRMFSTWNWSLKRFRARFDLWRQKRDWFVLVNRTKCGAAFQLNDAGLPEVFLAHVVTLRGPDSLEGVLLALKRQWRTGKDARGKENPIPGYEAQWSGRDGGTAPEGWTVSNISRQLKRRAGEAAKLRGELPDAFVEFWRTLCELHQRTTAAAWRELIELWKSRAPFAVGGTAYDSIPGYATWPAADPLTDLPPGWSANNLGRYAPDEYELAAARIGPKKASALGFKIRTSRFGLRLGEFMEFDDHEFNVKTNFPGQLRSMRPRCFGAVDALTDCLFSMVIKPTFWDLEAEAKRVLTMNDFMWFIVAVLTHRGYRADVGTMLLVEWGTAAIQGNKKLRIDNPLRDDFEKRIYDATGGKVRVDRGGRFHQPANPSQFAPPSGGNFRFKPHVEQFWRMLDDWLDALSGQTGKGRDFAPEEMERADAYNNKLLKAARTMGIEQASKLILPRMTFDEFTAAANAIAGLINDDLDHECNNWEKCGFVTKEFRAELSSPWQALPLLAQQPPAVQALVHQNDLHFRARRMSRWEADCKHRHELTVLPMALIPSLVGKEHAGDPIPVIGGKFTFQDRNKFCTPDPLVFVASDASGRPLPEGERYIPYCNPMSPDCLVICDARHAVVSVCPPDLEPARNDVAGVQAAMGAKAHWQAQKLAPQRARHAAAGVGMDFMRAHNAALTGAPATPAPAAAPLRVPTQDCTEELLAREAEPAASDGAAWE